MRRKTAILVTSIGVWAVMAGTAMAASLNTRFVEGYDPENRTLVFGASEIDDDKIDCTVADGTYDYTADVGGLVTSLKDDTGADVQFSLSGVSFAYTALESAPCALTAVDVTGPNGQVNHGQVVSSFVHALKEAGVRGHGCLVRFIAQSDYGKGDQQVTPTTVTTAAPTTTVTGDVDLTTHETTCNQAKHSDDDPSESSQRGNGRGNGNAGGNGNGHGHNGG